MRRKEDWVEVRGGTFPLYEHKEPAAGGVWVRVMHDASYGADRYYLITPDRRSSAIEMNYSSEDGARGAAEKLVNDQTGA